MIKLKLWDIINAKEPEPRSDIPESLDKPENAVGEQAKAEDAEDRRNRTEADPPECGHRGDVPKAP